VGEIDVPYVYVFVRTDITLACQLVQVGHACLEAGRRFEGLPPHCHLVLLEVASSGLLLDAVVRTQQQGIAVECFYEPDFPAGYTAACTEPVYREHRGYFKRYRMWRSHG
jgi:hypothetical protein